MVHAHRKWFIVLVVVVLALAACGRKEPTPTPTPTAPQPFGEAPEPVQPIARWNSVVDRVWVLVGYGNAANPNVVEKGTLITAAFDSEGKVSGSGGCNNYFAGYNADDQGNLVVESPIGTTMMACEQGGEQEATYLAALETVSGYALTDEGRLELTYSTGQSYEERLVYAPGQTPLAHTTWRLVSYGDPADLQKLEEGTSITAVFSPETEDGGTVAGNATCNNYTASYTVRGDQVTFGRAATTRMMCPVGADQESAYLAALASAQTFHIVGANMIIRYDGGVLNYTSVSLPLEHVLWQVLTVLGQAVPDEVEITALFAPGEEAGTGVVGGSAGCNSYNAPYEKAGESLTIPGPIASTMAMCPDEALANLERSYLSALEAATGYEILGDRMVLRTQEGDIEYAADRQPLEGPLWALVSWGDIDDPQPPVEGSNFTAQFKRLPVLPSGSVEGTTGCNEWNATYAANLSEIKVNLPSKGRNEDCPWGEGDYEVEQQFFLGLNSATHYRIVGNMLQIPYGSPPSAKVLNFVATQPPVEEVLDLTPLHGTFWYLIALGDQPVLPGTEVTAQFEVNADGVTGEMSGSAGCNAYNAPIGQNFGIGPIASTKKACDQPLMDQEDTYLSWLGTAYRYDRAGDQLLIPTANGTLIFQSQPVLDQRPALQNVRWHLMSYETQTPVPGYHPTLFFSTDGRSTSGTTGCNDFQGTYQAGQGNTLSIGDLSSTKAACATDALTRQEDAYLALLASAVRYSVNGAQLQVVTAEGGTMNFSSVPPAPPPSKLQAVIVAPDTGETGQELTFDGYQSVAGASPIVSYEWDMGDNTTFKGPVFKHTYRNPGKYTVALTVLDEATDRDTDTHVIEIRPPAQATPPRAVIVGPTQGNVGQQLTFDGYQSQAGSAAIVGYQWDMGDGTRFDGPVFNYAYGSDGTFQVTLTVLDSVNQSNTATQPVQIRPVAQTPPKAAIEGPQMAFVGERVTFSAAKSQQGSAAIAGYQWQSGDGNDTGQVPENTFTTIYAKPGTYFASVTVVDANGNSDSASISIAINANLAGTAWILGNTLPGTSIMLEFGNGTLSGFAGCNSYNAEYSTTLAAGNTNAIQVGPLTNTGQMCSQEIMDQEQAYLSNLQSASSYVINGSTLTLQTAGARLVYSAAQPTPFAAQ